jgi:hypothetical protein
MMNSVRTELQEPFCKVSQTLPALVLEVLRVYTRKDSGFNQRFTGDLTPVKRRVREEAKYKLVVLFFAHIDKKHQ